MYDFDQCPIFFCRCTLQLWSFEKESESFGGKGGLSPQIWWLVGLRAKKVRGLKRLLPFVNQQRRNYFCKHWNVQFSTKKRRFFVFIEYLMSLYAASTLVCVQVLVEMVDWGKSHKGSGVARVRWKLNTSTILALQTISTFCWYFVLYVSFASWREALLQFAILVAVFLVCYLTSYCFWVCLQLLVVVVVGFAKHKVGGFTVKIWGRAGWVWHRRTAPPNAALSSMQTRWWRRWRVALRGSSGRFWHRTATMRPPCGTPLAARPSTWRLHWERRPCWSGCWRVRMLTWCWRIRSLAGPLCIAVPSMGTFTVSYRWSKYVSKLIVEDLLVNSEMNPTLGK